MSIIEDLFNVIAPHECFVCGAEGNLLCQGCMSNLPCIPERCYLCNRRSDNFRTCKTCRSRSPLYAVWAVTRYEGPAKELLHALKFTRAKAGAGPASTALSLACGSLDNVLITHVPTAAVRIRERGYDQAALIAKAMSVRLGLPYLPLLGRVGNQRQVGQQRGVRKKQLEAAFRPLRTSVAQKRHILLVDDVLTTGATCEAAARTLRQAGAARVSAAVFAVA